MRREWTPEDLIASWTLVEDDWRLVGNKTGPTRLGFALLLKFFEVEGRFPRSVLGLDRGGRLAAASVRFVLALHGTLPRATVRPAKPKARPSLAIDFPDPAVESVAEVPVDWNTPHRFVGWGYFPLPSNLSASFSVFA